MIVSNAKATTIASLVALLGGGVGYVVSNGVTATTINTNPANRAAVAAQPCTQAVTVYPQTVRYGYTCDPISTEAADGVYTIAPNSGGGRWKASRLGDSFYRTQSTLFGDNSGCSDEYTCTADASANNGPDAGAGAVGPCCTMYEMLRRDGWALAAAQTWNLNDHGTNWSTTDRFAAINLQAQPAGISVGVAFTINGTLTTTTSGTSDGGSVPVPASNLASTFVADQDLNSSAGQILVGSGGQISFILGDAGTSFDAGVRVTRYANTVGTVQSAPINGDTYVVARPTAITGTALPSVSGPGASTLVNNFSIPGIGLGRGQANTVVVSNSVLTSTPSVQGGDLSLVNVVVNSAFTSNVIGSDSVLTMKNVGFLGTGASTLNVQAGGRVSATDVVFDKACVEFQTNATGDPFTNVSVYDCTSANGGLWVTAGAFVNYATALYGSGNTVGTQVNRLGRMFTNAGTIPTLTGTTELFFCGSATVFGPPTITAGAPVYPSTTVSSWAANGVNGWAGSNVNKHLLDVKGTCGASIMGP